MAIKLYPHNEKTYKKMTTMFKKDNRVGIVQPTGTGKSFIILKWIEDHPHDKFVVLSPSLEIFMQFVGYAKETGDEALLDSVQMLSYQTLIRMTEEKINQTIADKIVVDEFHRTGAAQWGPAFMKLLAANPNAKVLGTSATPVRYLDGQRDMAEELFDRNLAVEKTLGDAVQEGILPIPQIVEILYDVEGRLAASEQEIAQRLRGKERKKAEMLLEKAKRELAQADGAEVIFQKYMPHDHGKFIVFCRNKEHLQEMKKTVPKWLRLVNKNVRCYVSIGAQEDKDIQLWAYVGDNGTDAIKLLFTIDRLNEGLHAKGTDGVIMLRPTTSPIIYLQQMGRALAANKKSPIIFDMVNNFENVKVMYNGEPTNVLHEQILRAGGNKDDIKRIQITGAVRRFDSWMHQMEGLLYPTNDAIWEKMLALYVEYKKNFGEEPVQKAVYRGMSLGAWCTHQRQAFKAGVLSNDRIARLSDEGFVFDVLDAAWRQYFAAYAAYKKEFGREPICSTVYNGLKLGAWCWNQKSNFKKRALSAERAEQLRAVGFVLETLSSDDAWERNFQAYVAFKKERGQEPVWNTVYNGIQLGTWCGKQRQVFKNGALSAERVEQLQAAGFVLETLDYDELWERSFEAYVSYKKKFGKEPVWNTVYNGIKIGQWCKTQRRAYNANTLSYEKIQELRDVGFVFDSKEALNDQEWLQKLDLYVAYKKEFGKEPIFDTVYNGIKIGIWCSEQRKVHKNNKLSDERIQRLHDAGFVFDSQEERNDRKWLQKLDLYVAYKKEFGKEPPDRDIRDIYNGHNLGAWCRAQRRAFKNGKLSAERQKRLQSAGFGLKSIDRDEAWEQNFQAYVAFKKERGQEPICSTVYNGLNLGVWRNNQKQAYKNNKLSDDKIQKLRDAGFPFDSKKVN